MHQHTTLTTGHAAPRRVWLVRAAAAATMVLAAGTVAAQPTYPEGPITLVVPFPPGGLLDNVARIIAPRMAQSLGQPVVIDNKPGSGGNIGASAAAKAAPTGYTMLLGSPALTISPALYKRLPYGADDLVPVAFMGSLPNVLLVPASSPVRTARELIEQMRSQPGKLNYASNGNGTSLHLSMELLKSRTQTFVLHVPYRGSAPAMTALIGGEVQMMFDNLPPALSQIQGGRVRALAVTSTTRSPALPDVPTLQEAGVTDFDVTAWFGLMVPRGTPETVVRRLEAESAKALTDPQVIQALRKVGIEPRFQNAATFATYLTRERKQWQSVVDYAKITLDN